MRIDPDDSPLSIPTLSCCYVCGRSGCELFDEGPAVGRMCDSCAKGFAVP